MPVGVVIVGVVISSGRALKTVRVRIPKPFWESHIRKTFTRSQTLMVHDEREACVEGDVVRIEPGCISSNSKKYMVAEIISPVRTAEPRKSVETHKEWLARKKEKRAEKEKRRLVTQPWKWEDSHVLRELKSAEWLEAKKKYSAAGLEMEKDSPAGLGVEGYLPAGPGVEKCPPAGPGMENQTLQHEMAAT